MKNDINDPTWLTRRAATEIIRYAVDAVCGETSWFFRRPAKIDRIFTRQASSLAFSRALADKLAPLIEVDVNMVRSAQTISDLASTLLAAGEACPGFTVRLFAAMSVSFDYALRRRLSARLEWLDPWHEWKYFLVVPTSPLDEDYVLMCSQFSGASAFDLGEEMLEDSPVLVVDTICRIGSMLRMQIGELDEAYNRAGVEGLVRAFDARRPATGLEPDNPEVAKAAIVYLVSGQCCWGEISSQNFSRSILGSGREQ